MNAAAVDKSEESREIAAPDGLDAIAAEAAKFDAAQVQADAVEPEKAAISEKISKADMVSSERDWVDACEFGFGLVIAAKPGLDAEWTQARIESMGKALAKGAARWGWNIEQVFNHPAVAIGLAAWPMLVGLNRFVKQEKAANNQTHQMQPDAAA